MKKFTLLFLFALTTALYANGQDFSKPSEGKSLVYFVRLPGTGALINFKYFDGDTYLGKMNGSNYFLYERDPGPHVFWVAAENRDFITGDLQPNSTYVVAVQATMGAFKSAVRLFPVSPEDEKYLVKVKKIMDKKEPTELEGQEEDMTFFIKNGLKRYDKIQDNVATIDTNWTF